MESTAVRLAREMRSGSVCVLPSEVAVQSWAKRLLDEAGLTAVRLDRLISWDTCLRQLSPAPDSLMPASSTARTLFAHLFLAGQADAPLLTRLVPPRFASSYQPYVSTVAEAVSGQGIFTAGGSDESGDPVRLLEESLADDIRTVQRSYREFLRKAGMYDSSLLPLAITAVTEEELENRLAREPGSRRFVLFFPELIDVFISFSELPQALYVESARAGLLPVPSPRPGPGQGPVLEIYEHIGLERAALFSRITELLDGGTDPSDITVTAGNYDMWYPELAAGADLYSVPLVFRRGQAAASYPAARIFRALEQAASQNFSLESMKTLLLNAAIPWSDRMSCRALIRKGIEYSCTRSFRSGGRYRDIWTERLTRAGERELLAFYQRLAAHVRSITRSNSPAGCYAELMQFWNDYIDKERWGDNGDSADSQVISYCLDSFRSLIEICRRAGAEEVPGVYSVWLSVLENLWYVPQRDDAGISVYPYGVSAGTAAEHHLLVGMNESSTRRTAAPYPFLSEMDRQGCAVLDTDRTVSTLRIYAVSGKHVCFSTGRRDRDGAQLPCDWFAEEGTVREEAPPLQSDPLVQEQAAWFAGEFAEHFPARLLPVQREGFEQALSSVFAQKGDDFLREPAGPGPAVNLVLAAMSRGDDTPAVSPTAVDSFTQCPFAWFLEHALNLETVDFVPVFTDARTAGSLMHSCFAECYRTIEKRWGRFRRELAPRCRELLETIIEEKVAANASSPSAPPGPVIYWTRMFLLEHLPRIIEEDARLFEGWGTLFTEKDLASRRDAGYLLRGRLDRGALFEGEGGGRQYAVIDFKKNSRVSRKSFLPGSERPDSYQLQIYGALMLANGYGGAEGSLSGALYYDVTKGSYVPVISPSPEGEKLFSDLITRALDEADRMFERISAGDFTAVPSYQRCRSCASRDICRGRFAVR
jgi:RecB family exonuclease